MIYYWLHMLYLYVGAKFFWKKVNLDANLTRHRRVSILDCDSLKYMANSKYFYYMDFIRFEILFRSKLYNNTFKKGLFPVIASQKIIYKKPLKRWSKFSITLNVEGWDNKWVYHSHTFKHKNEIYAIGITKVTFWKHKKAQNMSKILKASGLNKPEKLPSIDILNLFKNDYNIIKSSV